jgi:hypothetical protein
MNLEKLKNQLSKFGTIEAIKEGVVFTLLMKGCGMASHNVVSGITMDVLDSVGDKYPNIEVMKNDDDFLLLVLRS